MSTETLFSHSVGRQSLGRYWFKCKDGDSVVRSIFDRHYSRIHYADGRSPKLFVGPGTKLVLITGLEDSIFIWRKFKDDSGQQGINCSVFRREGGEVIASELIRDADRIAFDKWPGERHYTYVKASAVQSTNPGACFIAAGWKRCGVTKVNKLLILELRASPASLKPKQP